MSHVNSLHLNDFDTNTESGKRPDRTRLVATIVTAGIVALIGVLVLVLGDNAPRAVPSGPADATQVATPESVGTSTAEGSDASASPAAATLTIPAGTALRLEVAEPVPGADVSVGNEIVATLVSSLEVDGQVAVPAGARVVGRVTETIELGENRGSAIFGVTFDRIEADGKSTPIVAALKDHELDLAPGRLLDLKLSERAEVALESADAG